MCGIVGYVGEREVVPILIQGLRKLEYRGYDSAGVAVVEDGKLDSVRAEGKLDRLVEKLARQPIAGRYGLGHTRWATHGKPIEKNAHPVLDAKRRVAVIHNGIVENFLPVKRKLQELGWTFVTDTDTEVVANLVSFHFQGDLTEAVRRAVAELEGMYAVAIVSTESPEDEIVVVRHGPPLVLGLGAGEQFLGSDPAALLAHTRDVVFLENGDVARMRKDGIAIWGKDGAPVERKVQHLTWDPIQAEKGGYPHFMLKEIFEQPQALQDTFAGRVDFEARRISFETLELAPEMVRELSRVHLLACGTSWHSALVGKFLIEELAGLPVEVDYGSEYRYRDPIVDRSVLAIGISQSGETADTLSAMEAARERGARLVAIANVPGSQATRISEGVLYTHAGPEIGVASTKAFTTQLLALYLLALYLRQQRGRAIEPALLASLAHLTQAVAETLELKPRIDELAREFQPRLRLPLPRPRHQLPDRARGRAQAEGDLLHPRRGLSRGRDEARTDRAHRRGPAGRRRGHRRAGLRQGQEQPPGGQGARRHRHRAQRPAGERVRGARRPRTSRCRASRSCCSRSSTSCRSSSWPTPSAFAAAPTSTSPATWPRASPSSERR